MPLNLTPMRHATLLLTLSASLHLNAQDFPFPTSDATWVQYYQVMTSPPPFPTWQLWSTANFCMDGADTLIAGTNYTRLYRCNAGYVGGIRSVDDAVYFFPTDSTQEYLLYDFGAAVGDTIHDVYVSEYLATGSSGLGWQETQLIDVVVTVKDLSSAYGGRIAMQVYYPLFGMDSEWIEGIGSIYGLFAFNPLNVSKYWYGMHCMSHNGTTYWNGGFTEMPGTCAPLTVGLYEGTTAGTYETLFPNPTTGQVMIVGALPSSQVKVQDMLGRIVTASVTSISTSTLKVDLSDRPAGMYHVSTLEGVQLGKVLKQ